MHGGLFGVVPRLSPPTALCPGHDAAMETVYTVLADSRATAQEEITRLCRLLDLAPMGAPSVILGRGRWLARAVESKRAPEGEKAS